MPQLSTPTKVTKTLSTDKTTVTVKWDDADKASDIQNFTVSLIPKDGSTPPPGLTKPTPDGATKQLDFTPPAPSPSSPAPTPASGSGSKASPTGKSGSTGKTGTATGTAPAPVSMPTAEELYSNYVATVVANPKDSKNTASDPGSETYWNFGFQLLIKIGDSDPIPLSKPSGSSSSGGVYVFASKDKPVTVTADDINTLVGTTIIPDTLFNSTPSLTIPKLALDTDNSLISFEIDTAINWTLPYTGLTVESFTFSVERKDGVHHALDDATATT